MSEMAFFLYDEVHIQMVWKQIRKTWEGNFLLKMNISLLGECSMKGQLLKIISLHKNVEKNKR